jgi:plastocyanin
MTPSPALARSLAVAALVALGGLAGGGAAAQVINACTLADAVDWFDAAPGERVVVFPSPSYVPRCARINAGQTVTWDGNFSSHPLRGGYYKGGGPQPGNPIPDVSSGSTPVEVAFPDAGAWGFYCQVHEPPMSGAIYVALFADGFESADLSAWSLVIPYADAGD